MKKNVLLLLLVIFLKVSNAQIIYDAKFFYSQINMNSPNLSYFSDKITITKTEKDTTWFNTTTNNPSGLSYFCLTGNKIYKYHKPTNNFNLYYDYNLNKNDLFITNIGSKTDTFKVDSTYFTNYGSLNIKTWRLTSKNYINNKKVSMRWLQGLGEINAGWDILKYFVLDAGYDLEATCIGDSILITEVRSKIMDCDFDSISKRLSLQKVNKRNLTIYPNPINDILNLKFEENTNYQVNIYDIKGNLIFNLNTNESNLEIDFSKFNSGIYFVKTLSNNSTETQRVIKL